MTCWRCSWASIFARLLAGCGWYALTNLLRAYRFGRLFDYADRRLAWRILPEMFAMNFLNNVLPSRTGELSFPYFMFTRHGISVGESTTVLVLARIFDYLAVASLFLYFALLELPNLDAGAARIVAVVGGLLVVSVLCLLLAPWLVDTVFTLFDRPALGQGRPDSRFAHLLRKARAQIVPTLRRVRSPRTYAQTLAWSLLVWLAMFACFTAFLAAIRLPQRYAIVIVGSTFATLAKAIPLITIGGFGAHEAGWALGFRLTGMETTTAITSGFAVNILLLLASAVFGGLALLVINLHRRRGDDQVLPADQSLAHAPSRGSGRDAVSEE